MRKREYLLDRSDVRKRLCSRQSESKSTCSLEDHTECDECTDQSPAAGQREIIMVVENTHSPYI